MYSYMANALKVHIRSLDGKIIFSHIWYLGYTTLEADRNHGRYFTLHCKKDENGWPILKGGWVVHEGWVETGLDNDDEYDLVVNPRAAG